MLEASEVRLRMLEMFLLKEGGGGFINPTPYVPPLSSLSHSLFSLHPLTLLDSNGDNIVQQSCYDVSRNILAETNGFIRHFVHLMVPEKHWIL